MDNEARDIIRNIMSASSMVCIIIAAACAFFGLICMCAGSIKIGTILLIMVFIFLMVANLFGLLIYLFCKKKTKPLQKEKTI